jgi:hypothetical protein
VAVQPPAVAVSVRVGGEHRFGPLADLFGQGEDDARGAA